MPPFGKRLRHRLTAAVIGYAQISRFFGNEDILDEVVLDKILNGDE